MSLTPEQLTQAVSEVQASTPQAIVEHLGTFGVDPAESQEIGDAAGAILGILYQMELGGEDATEEEVPTAENTPAESDMPDETKRYILTKSATGWKVTKAGSTFSSATKGKLKAMLESGTTHVKLIKALHDEAHAVKEESAPEPITKLNETEPKEFSLSEYKSLK